MENKSNYELLQLYRRLISDGLIRFSLPVQEEIYMRMADQAAAARPQFQLLKGGIA